MKKILSYILLVAVTFSFLVTPQVTKAVIVPQPVIEVGPVGVALVAGVGDAVTSNVSITTLKASFGNSCTATFKAADALEVGDSIDSISGGAGSETLDILSGGIVGAVKASAQIATATAAKECIDAYVISLQQIPVTSLLTGQAIQTEETKYTTISSSLRQKIDALKERQAAQFKDILRAFLVKLILNLNQNLTTQLVNNAVEKYKIDDYLAYADAVSTQVYSMKYINENYTGDAKKQAVLRSLIQSKKTPGKVLSAITYANDQAQKTLASNCGNLGASASSSTSDSSFYKCLASYGSAEASPVFQYLNIADEAAKVSASAQTSTQQEIDASQGFAPPRDCSGSIAMQQQIDNSYDSATKELYTANEVYEKLKEAYAQGQTTIEELNKAEQNLEVVGQKYNSLSNQFDSPVVDICKAITSPGGFVAGQLNSYLDQYLNQAANLKSDNLPFYANFVSGVASNFLSNLITGKKSNSQVLKEAGIAALAPTAIAVGSTVAGIGSDGGVDSKQFENNGVSVYLSSVGGTSKLSELTSGQTYQVNIDFAGFVERNNNAQNYRVVVRDKISGQLASLDVADLAAGLAKLSFVAPAGSAGASGLEQRTLFVELYDSSNNKVAEVGVGFNLKTGSVQGVSTVQVFPRGQAVVFSPR
ncbi:MAG: hypothetical protein R3B41_00560 [Candidatus Doudnabacteria bacterium]